MKFNNLQSFVKTFSLFLIFTTFIFTQNIDRKYWITNGNVFSVLKHGNDVFIGGDFTYVGPRTNPIVFIDKNTGNIKQEITVPDILFSFKEWQKNPQIYHVIKSDPSSNTYYIVGNFSKIGENENPGVVVKATLVDNSLTFDENYSNDNFSPNYWGYYGNYKINYKQYQLSHFDSKGLIIEIIESNKILFYNLITNEEKVYNLKYNSQSIPYAYILDNFNNKNHHIVYASNNDILFGIGFSDENYNSYHYILKINLNQIFEDQDEDLDINDYKISSENFAAYPNYFENQYFYYDEENNLLFYRNFNSSIIVENIQTSKKILLNFNYIFESEDFSGNDVYIMLFKDLTTDKYNFAIFNMLKTSFFSIPLSDIQNSENDSVIYYDPQYPRENYPEEGEGIVFKEITLFNDPLSANIYPYNIYLQGALDVGVEASEALRYFYINNLVALNQNRYAFITFNKIIVYSYSGEEITKVFEKNMYGQASYTSDINIIENDNYYIIYGPFSSYGGKELVGFAHLNDLTGEPVENFESILDKNLHIKNRTVLKLVENNGFVYFAGSFAIHNGNTKQTLTSLGRYNISQKQIDWSFNPIIESTYYNLPVVSSMDINNNVLYLGGNFDKINGIDKKFLAAIDLNNYVLVTIPALNFLLDYNDGIHSIKIINDSLLIAGGNFTITTEGDGPEYQNFVIINLNSDSAYFASSFSNYFKFKSISYSNYDNSLYISGYGWDNNEIFIKKLNMNNLNLQNIDENISALNFSLDISWEGDLYPPIITKCETINNFLIIGGNFRQISYESSSFECDNVAIFDLQTNQFLTNWKPNPDLFIWNAPAKPNKRNKTTFGRDYYDGFESFPINDFFIDIQNLQLYIGGSFTYFGNDLNYQSFARVELPANLPVELISFEAVTEGNNVVLKWKTATEVNNLKFEVERRSLDKNSQWIKIGEVQGGGNASVIREYSYTDKNLNKGKYAYRLKQVDYDGKFSYTNSIEIEITKNIEFALYQNYPNPFNPETTVKFSLAETGRTRLELYNALGQLVAVLIDQNLEGGKYYEYKLNGSKFASGVYILRLSQNQKVNHIKINLIK